MHQFNRVDAACRVAGVARLPLNANRVGHVAFVRAYRLQRCGLADNGAIRSQLGRLGEVAGAGHAGLFIGRRQNIERLFQLSDVNVAQGVKNKSEEAFHIRGAETIQLIVVLGQGKRVAGPAAIIKRDGIGVPGKQQAASAVAAAGQQVEFIARVRDWLNFNIKADIAEPASQ